MCLKYTSAGIFLAIIGLMSSLEASEPSRNKKTGTPICASVQECEKALLYGSTEIKIKAIDELSKMKSRAVPSLISAIHDGSAEVREKTIQAIRSIGPDAKDAIPPLLSILKSNNKAADEAEIQTVVMYALSAIGAAAVPGLVDLLGDTNTVVRQDAIWVLDNMGLEGKAAVPALLEVVKDSNSDVSTAAMLAIGRIGPDAKTAISMLLPLLENEKKHIRLLSAGRLQDWVSSETKEAVPPLIASLNRSVDNRDDEWFREEVVDALWKIGPSAKAAVPALINLFHHKKMDNLVPKAVRALANIGPEAALELVKVINDKTSTVREVAALALAKFGESYVPVLVDALKDEDSEVRGSAALALGRIGPGAKNAVPALIEVLRSSVTSVNEEHNVRAAIALGDIGPNAKEAVPALIESLKDDDALRRFSVEALGKIGPAAKAAVPHLEAVLKYSNDSWCRDEIKKALKQIGTK
ncbi:MAG: hypothetical protein A2234_00800 [Elusimicrobia bacterium RIFOXYA2_FULL_58_8]|nr:MAG: hypothetical protein A2285_06080 [Elusimicrobia bacterium RIFOXYA12_FULL_57_11]OGS12217.1 MAG: hypothetical protein A2234_00800 [Elusimicrobia bacterium RIFOXYA2_FULL_58_8]